LIAHPGLDHAQRPQRCGQPPRGQGPERESTMPITCDRARGLAALTALSSLAGAALLLCLTACSEREAFVAPDQLPASAGLPDPFLAADGTRIATAAQWPAQRAHLLAQVLHYGYGHPPAAGTVTVAVDSTSHDDALKATRRALTLSMGPLGAISVHLFLIIPDGHGPFPAIIEGDRCWGALAEPVVAAAIARGYLLAQFDRTEIAPDKPDRSRGLYLAYPDSDGGALAAWAWGYARVIDALITLPEVDAKRVAITGHSRGGKAVLLAGALDERVALVAPNGSGCMGAGCERQLLGEVESLDRIVTVFPYWFTPLLAQFKGHVERLPFDQHTLKALIAPRALLTTEGLGDLWANPRGTQVTFQAAQQVYRFLGCPQRIGIAYRPGKHEHNLSDWQALLDFADHQLCGRPEVRRFDVLQYPDESHDAFSWVAPAAR
jgi:hypothetical protein